MSRNIELLQDKMLDAATDGLAQPRRAWAMLAVGLAVTMAVLDANISNVALPTIARELHTSPTSTIWVANAYQVAATVSLLPLASLGEILGYHRVYRGGLVLFLVGSLACALSFSLPVLIASRVLQGFGAAGILAVNGAMIRFIYPRRLLGRGIGLGAMIVASAAVVAPAITAGVLSVAGWPYLFAINLPIGVAAILVGLRTLPETPAVPRAFDRISAVLSALALGFLVVSIGGLQGVLDLALRGSTFVMAIAFLVALVRRQAGLAAPLLPVDLFRIPLFRRSAIASTIAFTSQGLAFVALPFYLQIGLGRSLARTGTLLTAWPLALMVAAPVVGRLSDRVSAGLLGCAGMSIVAFGLAIMWFLPARPADGVLVWCFALCGAGFGLFAPPNNRIMLQSAPRERSGAASGLMATSRLLGQTTGVTLVGAVFAFGSSDGPIRCVLLAAALAAATAALSLYNGTRPVTDAFSSRTDAR